MRTTLNLDNDIAARLAAEAVCTSRSFKDTGNDARRSGLGARQQPTDQPFHLHARDLGALHASAALESVAWLPDDVDGPGVW